MANPGVWYYGSSAIPTGPIKVKDEELKKLSLFWYPLNVNSANFAVQNTNWTVDENSGQIIFQYPTNKNNPNGCGDGSGQCTTANSIQEIADDSLYVSAYGYTTDTTTAIQAALLESLNTSASAIGLTPSGTQPAPSAPGSTGDGGGSAASEGQFSGPTEALTPLDFGKDTFGYYKYPSEYDSNQDRIQFYQIQYLRTGVVQTETDIIKNETKTRIEGGVTLPMPNEISETNSVGWGEDSLSNAAALLMGPLAKGAIGISDVNLGQLKDSALSVSEVIGRSDVGKRVQQSLATRAAASLVGKLGINVNAEAYITRATGAAVNPNMELLFNGPKLRQFAFQFKMTPRNEPEAKQIRGILRFFKKGMSPRRSDKSDLSFFLGTPNIFRIKFMSGSNQLKSIGQIKTCALVSFSANYTPDGFYAAYSDTEAGGSQPIAVTMQMAFTELTPVFSDEYRDNDDNEVGPNEFSKNYNVLNYDETSTGTSTGQQGAQGAQGVNPLGYLGVPAPPPSPDGQPNFGLGVPPPW